MSLCVLCIYTTNADACATHHPNALGDDEEVRIWDLDTSKCLQTVKDSTRLWGQITALEFVNLEKCGFSKDSLCFGTGHGQFLIYQRNRRDVRYCPPLLFTPARCSNMVGYRRVTTKFSASVCLSLETALKAFNLTHILDASCSRAIMARSSYSLSRRTI